jgi:alcohol dehydrogenase
MLVAQATRMNIDLLEARDPDSPVLGKYAEIGKLFRGRKHLDAVGARVFLVHTLTTWTQHLNLPRLSAFGVSEADIPKIVANSRGSSMKTNPVELLDDEIADILRACL